MNRRDEFTEGYIECLWFTASDDDETMSEVIEDCRRFQEENETLLHRAYRRNDDSGEQYSKRRAGHDLCFSRNGHGTGFWDRLEGPIGEQLHKRAQSFGEQNLCEYDGKLGVE